MLNTVLPIFTAWWRRYNNSAFRRIPVMELTIPKISDIHFPLNIFA